MENNGKMILVRKTPHSSTRALWKSCQQEELGKGNDKFDLTKYFCSYFKASFNMP
jgi:hypothetical protein